MDAETEEIQKPVLKRDCWYADDHPEHLVFFEVYQGHRRLWSGMWFDVRELTEDPEVVEFMRLGVRDACERFGVECDVSGDCWMDWA